jgi:hypothetical protein
MKDRRLRTLIAGSAILWVMLFAASLAVAVSIRGHVKNRGLIHRSSSQSAYFSGGGAKGIDDFVCGTGHFTDVIEPIKAEPPELSESAAPLP